ncbi:UNVERIFIED_CONTAM: hypothetical protein Sangu_2259700 [Sesamum angustifolium]|uniref:Uncharacterized protein n=1 Tax=Sesamum angustifolium TaxID=2727405 RepID=A0AAW2L7S8_9LAMI
MNSRLTATQGICALDPRRGRGLEALAIDEKGFDPKAFKLLIKAGYDPKKSSTLENFLLKPPGKNSTDSTLPK